MKFSLWLISAFAAASKVLAEETPYYEKSAPQEELPELQNYVLEYSIEEYTDISASETVPLLYGETITLNYDFTNEEENAITIVGLGGSFLNPSTGESAVNMTANSVEPVVIKPQTSGKVRQKINIEFPVGDYILAPVVYVAYNDVMKGVPAQGKLVNVSEAPVSFFNPQLIFLELIFFAIIGAIAYYYYGKEIRQFLNESVVPTNQKTATTAATSGASSSWIPKNYHPVERKSKSRKAY